LFFVAGFPDTLSGAWTRHDLLPRIDEVNLAEPNSPWKGNVWSFTIPSKTAYENPANAENIDERELMTA
jgi:hypothetical protein